MRRLTATNSGYRGYARRLHDRHRQAGRIDALLDIAPTRPRLNGDPLRRRVKRQDAIESTHVEEERPGRDDLATHAVA